MNEPGITAMCSALFGIWNDRRSSVDDYFVALGNITVANLEAVARVRADRDGWWVGAEGFGCDLVDPGDAEALETARTDQALQQAAWDLHLGVEPWPEVARLHDVIADGVRSRIAELVPLAAAPDRVVAGHDIYPVSVRALARAPAVPSPSPTG